jgi:2-phospho-L-lactate/phosphoenolpyruvate guanylyltransferase
MRIIAVPVKSLSRAKSRLSPVLSPLERGALTLAMLEDVLDATLAIPTWETWVISPDEAVLEIAARRRATPVTETKPTLASAVRQIEEEAKDRGADSLAILLGDTALVSSDALQEALRTLGSVVLARSDHGGGTNLLLRRPPRAIAARFGPSSFERHLHGAETRGIPAAVVDRPELAFDLDVPEDVATVIASGRETRTRNTCLSMDLGARLRIRA